jgi:alkylhydroperoxidase family enzyme
VLTNAQFIAQADAICDRSNARITAIKPRNNSPSEVQRIVPRHLALERATIAALEKLTPPEALAGNWAQVLKVRRTLAHELDELLAAAKRHDAAAIGKLGSAKGLAHLVLTNAAHGAGLKQCGRLG